MCLLYSNGTNYISAQLIRKEADTLALTAYSELKQMVTKDQNEWFEEGMAEGSCDKILQC